jgi:hypothetical protein
MPSTAPMFRLAPRWRRLSLIPLKQPTVVVKPLPLTKPGSGPVDCIHCLKSATTSIRPFANCRTLCQKPRRIPCPLQPLRLMVVMRRDVNLAHPHISNMFRLLYRSVKNPLLVCRLHCLQQNYRLLPISTLEVLIKRRFSRSINFHHSCLIQERKLCRGLPLKLLPV